jgi:hypothetical protein
MKEALLNALNSGLIIEIKKDMLMCYITVKDQKNDNERTQCLPLDHHIETSLAGCINLCARELLKLKP